MSQVNSPLTGTGQVTLVKSIPVQALIRQWQAAYGIDVSGEIGHHGEILLYRCDSTGLEFFWPRDVAGSGRLYEQLQRFAWYYEPRKWEHRVALKDLKRLLPTPKGAKVIEVGCGEGSFVSDARVGGFDAEGIELNAAAVRAAVARGIPVRHVDVAEAAAANAGAADAVCAFQVLEHVPEVGAFLESCVRMLKPGGLLVLCVPNAQSYLRDLDVPLDMPPHHMSRWSRGALAALSTVLPVDLEITREEPLRRTHVRAYVAAQAARSRALGRPAWSSGRAARAATMALLYAGLRYLARGQSIYAVLRRRSA